MHEIILLIKNVFLRTDFSTGIILVLVDKQKTNQTPHSHGTYSVLERQTTTNEQTNILKLVSEKCYEKHKA